MPTIAEKIAERKQALAEGTSPSVGWGETYKQNVSGPAHDALDQMFSRVMPSVSPETREMLIGMAVPETLGQAGIMAGSMLVPGVGPVAGTAARGAAKIGPMAMRIMGPAMGGAIGGYLEKYDSGDAAMDAGAGGALGAFSEVASAALGRIAKSRLGKIFAKKDPQALNDAVQMTVDNFPNLQTPEAFQAAVYGGLAQKQISAAYESQASLISKRLAEVAPMGSKIPASQALQAELPMVGPGGQITGPTIQALKRAKVISSEKPSIGMTFDDAVQAIHDLRLKGKVASGDPAVTLTQAQARDYAAQLSDEVQTAVATVDGGLATRFKNMNEGYKEGSEMLRFLNREGAMDENGNLNMRVLQEAFREERAAGINRTFGPGDVKRLRDAIFRGADATALDVIKKSGQRLGVGVGPTGNPRLFGNFLDFLKSNSYAGKYDLPAPYLSPKAIALGASPAERGTVKYLEQKPISLGAQDKDSK